MRLDIQDFAARLAIEIARGFIASGISLHEVDVQEPRSPGSHLPRPAHGRRVGSYVRSSARRCPGTGTYRSSPRRWFASRLGASTCSPSLRSPEISDSEAGDCSRDAIVVLSGPRDIVGRIARCRPFHAADLVEHRGEQPVEA